MSKMYWVIQMPDGSRKYYPACHWTKETALADAGEGAVFLGTDFS